MNAARQALENLSNQWPGDTDITRGLVLLGEWARTHELLNAAQEIYKFAADLGDRQGIGEHLLWVSDLAERLGLDSKATEIRMTLLNNRCLPASRIATLLEKIASRVLAHQLSLAAASYCQEPGVQAIAGR